MQQYIRPELGLPSPTEALAALAQGFIGACWCETKWKKKIIIFRDEYFEVDKGKNRLKESTQNGRISSPAPIMHLHSFKGYC